MITRPADFLHDPKLMRMRNELADICYKALAVARHQKGDNKDFTYNFTSAEYIELRERRDVVIERIEKYWSNPNERLV
jgi:ribulose 1,5-bisphosphate carboxylase large subunit-like protein